MNTSTVTIKNITFRQGAMTLHFSDGRKVSTPIAWYPRLDRATAKQRNNWQILGKNRGIHWPDVDEDLSIEGILHGVPSVEYRRPAKPRRKAGSYETGSSV